MYCSACVFDSLWWPIKVIVLTYPVACMMNLRDENYLIVVTLFYSIILFYNFNHTYYCNLLLYSC
jgi:hypothetical protein